MPTGTRTDVVAELAWVGEIRECGVGCGCVETALVLLLGSRECTRIGVEYQARPTDDERDDMIAWVTHQARLLGAARIRYFEGPILSREEAL